VHATTITITITNCSVQNVLVLTVSYSQQDHLTATALQMAYLLQ